MKNYLSLLFSLCNSALIISQANYQPVDKATETLIRDTLKEAGIANYKDIPIIAHDNNRYALASIRDGAEFVLNTTAFATLSEGEQTFTIFHESGHLYYNHHFEHIESCLAFDKAVRIATGIISTCAAAYFIYHLMDNNVLRIPISIFIGSMIGLSSRFWLSVPMRMQIIKAYSTLYLKPHQELEANQFAIEKQGTAYYGLKFLASCTNQNTAIAKIIYYLWLTGHYSPWYEYAQLKKYALKHNIPLDKN